MLKLHKEEGLLTNNSRRKICNLIVQDLLAADPDARVSHETLFSLAQEIKELFPKENICTYFIPYINNSKIKVKTCAKGKLYDCLHNRKREYRLADKKNVQHVLEQEKVYAENQENGNNKIEKNLQQSCSSGMYLHICYVFISIHAL